MAAVEPAAARHPLTGPPAPDARAARAASRTGLYLHVPFCAVRCGYCHFSSGPLSSARVERYLAAIAREAALRAPLARGVRFTSAFIGGGTPSALSARAFGRLWSVVRDHFAFAPDAEITLEANPETVKPALLDAWRTAGVNRLSMGAQSFDEAELRRLGRVHGPGRPGDAFVLARGAGFERLSLDLMYGFPGHTAATWERTLDAALALEPGHLSAYCYIPEEDTPMGRETLADPSLLPSPEEQAARYEELGARMGAAGFRHYETSNFARPGEEVRHHLVYWLRRDYLALGPSAHGLWDGVRYANAYGLEAWAGALERAEDPSQREPATAASAADEIVMLALRLEDGLQPDDHGADAWAQVRARHGLALAAAVAGGRLEAHGDGWRVAPRHRFVADDIIAWVLARARDGAVDTLPARSVTSAPCPIPSCPAA